MSYSNDINTLPTDKSIPSDKELDLIETFFEDKDVETNKNVKLLLVFIIFMIIFSIKDADYFIIKNIKFFQHNNNYIFGFKLLVASILFYATLKYFK
tara:strand:+ start:52 stop:342 length:291 start_codon:yes stop_codon:yes gene_type:complete